MSYFERGRRSGVPGAGRKKDPTSKAGQLRAKKQAEEDAESLQLFEIFEQAEDGIIDGYKIMKPFHAKYYKGNALITSRSNGLGICEGVNVCAQHANVYFFCEPKDAKKQVRYNYSVYIF